jgi:hypothetical protein
MGPKCADNRDTGPAKGGWKCKTSELQTVHCPFFFNCNYTTGQCVKSTTPGAGTYPDEKSCDPHCFPVPPAAKLYRCNISDPKNYKCEECKGTGDPKKEGCGPKDEACKLCQAPPPKKYKCDKTNPEMPKCQKCENQSDPTCGEETEACKDCNGHIKPKPVKRFMCNITTHKCVESNATGSLPELACGSACTNSTPAQLKNTVWRGIEVETGFKRAEVDLKFGEMTFEVKFTPSSAGPTFSGTVSSGFDGTSLHVVDGPDSLKGKTINFNQRTITDGPETSSAAFLFGAVGAPAPQSIVQAMQTPAGGKVFLMSKCKSLVSKECDFSSVFTAMDTLFDVVGHKLASAIRFVESPFVGSPSKAAYRGGVVTNDPCNVYTDCASCIGSTVKDFNCGWCIGDDVVYNTSGMPTTAKCAGQPTDGSMNPFTCPSKYSTEDCVSFTCDWNAAGGPQCKEDKTGAGQWPSMDDCENKGQCNKNQSKTLQKCDFKNKKCVSCKQGEPGCDTPEHCKLSGCETKQFQKCDLKTKKCSSCTPTGPGDKNCSMDSASCSKICAATTFGICDPDTGKCAPCDPAEGKAGCVTGCSDNCKKHPKPPSPSDDKFVCQWYPVPKCLNDSKGTDSKESCEKNCKAESFAKCDTSTGKCKECNQSAADPDCKNTMDFCNATCKGGGDQVTGVFRGIQINQGFHVGEWDFDFSGQGSVKITFTGDEQQVYAATPTVSGGSAGQASPITLKFTAVPAGNNFLGVKSGDVLKGIFKKEDGQSQVFQIMHLATAKTAGEAAPADFKAAMASGYEFDLFACKKEGEGGCDFSAMVKQALSKRNTVTIN